ncbi:MAG TPA: Asp-tRNA(Asn)/Glu-tRNA(Gln) amidotransferase subunit GatA [Dictyoglomaceae bacterium]|nr:Asp-tRNA(Asn)/Glu-tRNA(Gln) amidotransferase subunit GatA [Dictyoglomaceae bacterium]HOL40001.1 Asp-tRNA(Asn)/Glu-tRNA(Gln) amidotransferase subunit GatA [Dictyoglomaceae bacterium]HOP95438.1 Asp-tRNA(Asn)/Glu-tRNA(Gln) amidotransferase subunit GatA [Dictyoglomaceae bacterium]HPP15594.1 Asp-tRNA(Asn)/Glu-tRNA(Gln) amidotransferase subunit GatA [Dictyoglomaceae bacterium]HPU42909.1 Asp-tRNA(Asn)/Glu-tRNA(Gln) amidotransferase subunit GatA [Dictyoglomaceae bacterium]
MKSVKDIKKLYQNKELKVYEVVEHYLKQIEEWEPNIHAFLNVPYKEIEAQLTSLKEEPSDLPLYGIPIAIKDNMLTKGITTTCASKILENFIPPYDATVVKRLKKAGAIIIGKTNLDEFAMGSSTENSAFGVTKNPWDLDRVPGGSSGGSAACVSSGEAPISLGSDTGGSIRLPASFTSVIGLKPTYGLVSRYGLVAFASSLDQIGPFGRRVEDVAEVLQVIAGHDPKDSTSSPYNIPNYLENLGKTVKGWKVGIPKELWQKGVSEEVLKVLEKSFEVLKNLGIETVEISLPSVDYALSVYYIIATSEASSNLARYDGVKYGYRENNTEDLISMYKATRGKGFGSEVKRRIILGTYALSAGYYDAYYLKAAKVRNLIKMEFEEAFKKVDIIVSPTSPILPFKIGEKISDPLQMYLTDIMTIPVNLAGIPAISMPAGFYNSLPVGIQFMGNFFSEDKLLQFAYAYQENIDLSDKFPPLPKKEEK